MQDGEIGVVRAGGTSLDISRAETAPDLELRKTPAPRVSPRGDASEKSRRRRGRDAESPLVATNADAESPRRRRRGTSPYP